MITVQGSHTGLLGYSRKKEFLGGSLNYRDVEVFQFEIAITDLESKADVSAYIEDGLRSQFSSFSGDINIKTVSVDASVDNDHIRISRYNTVVELRSPNNNLLLDYPELSGDYYSGMDGGFFLEYSNFLDSLNESYEFSDAQNGNKSFNHSLSFGLRSGAGVSSKTLAQNIAGAVFNGSEGSNRYGINVFESALTQYGASSGAVSYTETYDTLNGSFAFNKQKEILPAEAGDKSYTYGLKHVIEVNEDGVVTASEQGEIKSQASYETAVSAFETLYAGSYSRCSGKCQSLSYLIGDRILVNVPTNKTSTHIKPSRIVTYSVKYNNNPKTNSNGYEEEEIFSLDRDENSSVKIDHQYTYTILGNNSLGLESTIVPTLISKKASSPAKCLSFYALSEFYRLDWLSGLLAPITTKYKSSVRGKSYSATFSYSNSPIYITSLPLLGAGDINDFKLVSIKVSDSKPADIINEYKIINKSDARSILNYGYQSTEGRRSVSIEAQLARPQTNVLQAPYKPSDAIAALYQRARFKLVEDFVNTPSLKIVYFLSDLKYSFDNKNKVSLTAELTYASKREPTP